MKNSYINRCKPDMNDYGPEPFIVNIESATKQNNNYRTTLWTGEDLQVTLMCIPPCGEIGLEAHHDNDQLLRIEEGCGVAMLGPAKERLNYQKNVCAGHIVMVPARTWHNIVNTGSCPLKLYAVYAPPHHPHGTVHRTKEIADIQGD